MRIPTSHTLRNRIGNNGHPSSWGIWYPSSNWIRTTTGRNNGLPLSQKENLHPSSCSSCQHADAKNKCVRNFRRRNQATTTNLKISLVSSVMSFFPANLFEDLRPFSFPQFPSPEASWGRNGSPAIRAIPTQRRPAADCFQRGDFCGGQVLTVNRDLVVDS